MTTDPAGSQLNAQTRAKLIDRFKSRKTVAPALAEMSAVTTSPRAEFEHHPAYKKILLSRQLAKQFGATEPFFRMHEDAGGAVTKIEGRDCLNFASYDYLGLNRDPRLSAAALEAMERYGLSASASRLVAGERPVHKALEAALAAHYGAQDCLTFVSGHATNVSTISTLFGPRDLILHDELAHNSIIEGARLSGAARRSFAHNAVQDLERLLILSRAQAERVLIVIEGHYSMDGDTPDLAAFIALKRKYGAFLMVDEAHALGVLGDAGRGSFEAQGIAPQDVDIWMGTLSKTLCTCGGYIASSAAMIEILRYGAPGFVYSVGLAPPLAAAALKALDILYAEPWRVKRLQENGKFFLARAKEAGFDTGRAEGHAIVPILIGSSLKSVKYSQKLLENGINVQPIIPPAVEERAARLRFFLCADHKPEDLSRVVNHLASRA